MNTCLWDWFLEVRLLGQSVWAFLILIHINKLLSTEDLPVLSPAIHGSFRFPRALPQSALSKLLDFFQFDRQNWYFNRILVWISIITSDCRPFLCLVLFVFSLFILQNLYPFSIFLLHCWSFSHWFIETLYILGNIPIGFLYFDFINHFTYNFVYGVACHTFLL